MKIKTSVLPCVLLLGLIPNLGLSTASAATQTWDPLLTPATGSYGSGNWDNTAVDWSTGGADTTYVSNSDVVFGGTSTGSAAVTLDATAESANSLTLNSTGYTFSGSALTVSGTFATAPGISVAANDAVTFNDAVNFSNGTGTFSNVGLGNGSSATFTGGGTWVNTFKVSNLANTGTTTGTLNLNGGTYTMGALWTQAVVNQGAATLTNVGTSLIGYAGNSTYTLNNASGIFNQNGGQNLDLGRGGTSGTFNLQNGQLNLSSGSAIAVGFRDVGTTGTLNVSGGTLSGASNTIYIVDDYNNATGSGFTGKVAISGGTTTVAGLSLYGDSSNTATVFSGTNSATLNLSGGALYVGAGGIALSTATSGTRTYAVNLTGGTVGATANWASSLNMALGTGGGGVTIQAANSTGTAENIGLTGIVSGLGGLTKTGAGTLTLGSASSINGSANTYSGPTTISAGTLSLFSGGTSSIEVAAGATLQLQLTTAIDSSAMLTVDIGAAFVTLNYTDPANNSNTDTIGSLLVGTYAFNPGTYSATQLNTLSGTSDFSGAGSLDVLTLAAPEPGSWALLLGGLGGLVVVLRWRRPIQMADDLNA